MGVWSFRLLMAVSALLLLLSGGGTAWALAPVAKEDEPSVPAITVAIDDTYPPYVFRDETGQLRGILPELWSLWSQRTGVAVRLQGQDWGEALRRFAAGEADVVDTAFRTPARERTFIFSEPYASIDVSIFFSGDLSGIGDARTVRGFAVGVKDGDACIDKLVESGIDSFRHYSSYEALVDGAGRGEVKVFCIDKPPGAYFLVKKGLEGRFRASPPLYTGQFHWAVLNGRDDLRRMIQAGFDRISPEERRIIEERWQGQALHRFGTEDLLRSLRPMLLAAAAATLALLAWVWTLRRQVRARTAELTAAVDDLAVSERRFRTIFDTINDAILVHDVATGAILQVNHRVEELYGWTAQEIIQLGVDVLSEGQPPYGRAEALKWIARSAEGPQVFEWRARHRDGSLFWAEVAMRRADIDGGGERLLVVVRDISERKEAEERLTRTIDALTRSNADLERFAYIASHDLREPLNTVVRYAQLLESRYRGRLDGDLDAVVGFVVGGAKHMLSLVEGLLEFSRIEGGTTRAAMIDADGALRAALENLGHTIGECGAEIVAGPLPRVRADEVQLIQLFQNLIGNALKYRAPERPVRVEITCGTRPGGWEFTVADNGIGLDPAYAEQIFVIFKRLHTQQGIPGTGIGLALCKRIVERHGGRIWVDSAPGEGARFHFTLAEDGGLL